MDSSNGNDSLPQYPRRNSHFAHRYTRTLTKSAAAQDIGADGCWLCSLIAHQEDAKRYSGPVTFWNDQLLSVGGFRNTKALNRTREKCVDAGWLFYQHGTKSKAGRYWCLIPLEYQNLWDSPTDEDPEESTSTENRQLSLLDDPSDQQADAADVSPRLRELIDGWNGLADSIVKTGNRARTDPPSKAVLDGWRRAERDPELREAFKDVGVLLRAIGRAKFCHGADWFSLAWLFGRNQNRELNAVKLLQGGYDNAKHDNGKSRPIGPGQRYAADASTTDAAIGRF